MTFLVNKLSSYLFGDSAIDVAPGKSGPTRPATEGLFGSGGFDLEDISTGLNLGSAAMTLFASKKAADAALSQSKQQAKALELSSQEDLLQADQEKIKSKQEANNLMEATMRLIADQRAVSAANGFDITFGTPVSTEQATRDAANVQLSVSREDANLRSLSRRRQAYARISEASNIRQAGKQNASAARISGFAQAGSTVADLVMKRKNRG